MTGIEFEVVAVFTLSDRAGSLVFGYLRYGEVFPGMQLSPATGDGVVTILGIEFSTQKSIEDGTTTLVLSSDLGGLVSPGAVLHVPMASA